jgi:CIC family chloride channel protein
MKKSPPIEDRLGDFTANPRLLLLTLMALFVGAISALVAKLLLWLIAVMTNLAFFQRLSSVNVTPQQSHLGAWIIIIPSLGGIVTGLMARYGSEKIRGHGIPEALEAILIGRSRISAKVAILKPISSAISIGTGGPFGAEGPIIMTGGACGSLFAQLFHLSPAERKTLLVAGASAGMAAIFNAPIAAVMLAVEMLLFEWKPRSLIPVAAASLMAAALRVPLLGGGPIFPVTPHAPLPMSTLALSCAVGIIAGFGSGLLTTLVYGFEDLFHKLPFHWMWWPAIGGLAVGIGGYFEPAVLGVGYGTIHSLLRGDLLPGLLLGLLIGKAIVWSIALGSGTSGGVLAPLLMMGGALGALEAHWLGLGDVGFWAMISMAAVMGGTMRSPFTAAIFTLELTHDTNALPALFVGCIASVAVTVLLLKRSILTEKFARRGYHIMREYSVDPFETMRVGEVMDREVSPLSSNVTVAVLAHRLAERDPAVTRHHALPLVTDTGELAGIITRSDVLRAMEQEPRREMTVLAAGSAAPIVAYADEMVQEAVTRMLQHKVGRLLVVDRENPTQLVGYLGRPGILESRLHRMEEEHLGERGWLGGLWRSKNAAEILPDEMPSDEAFSEDTALTK